MNKNKYLLTFIFFDLLVLPRVLPLFGIPISLPFVILLMLKDRISQRKFLVWYIIIAIGFISASYGIIVKFDSLVNDLKRTLQLSTSLVYGLVYIKATQESIEKALSAFRLFFFWIIALGVVSVVAPDFYLQMSQSIYPEISDSAEQNVEVFRFSYFFADPNSAGYFICFATYTYLKLEKRSGLHLAAIFAALFTVGITQSRGAYICFIFITVEYFFLGNLELKKRISIFAIASAILCTLMWLYSDVLEIIIRMYEYRNESEAALGEGLGGGRIGKYEYFFSNLNLAPLGNGYNQFRDGVEFRPHSDLIRINFAYGLPFAALLGYFTFPRLRANMIYFIIFLIPFLINTVIDDHKLFPFYLFSLSVLQNLNRTSKTIVSTTTQIQLDEKQIV
jgi:hypothetical protein